MAFLGKFIAVTGGASGIGRATAKALWSRGATLTVSDISSDGLKSLTTELNDTAIDNSQRLFTSLVDVTRSDQVDSWIAKFVKECGTLDGAANVAGRPDFGKLLAQMSDADFDTSINLNLRGTFNCMRAELNHMGKGASIVNMSSMAGIIGVPGVSLYCAAKHGINGLTKCAAREYGPKGIRVNSVCPGIINTVAIDTPDSRHLIQAQIDRVPLGRWGEPEETAKVVAFLLSEESSFQSGSTMTVDGGTYC